MSNQPTNISYDVETEPEFSFRQLFTTNFKIMKAAFQYRKLLLMGIAIGAILGLTYSFIKSKTYTAKLTFIVEDSKASGGSMVSALAGQLGFDIGSLSGGSGILAGDNVLELLKSESFIKKALLTNYSDSSDNGITLADQYANVYHWKEKWKNSEEVGKNINFYASQNKVPRTEDSLLQVMILRISEKELNISKPDKKLNIFEIDATMRDEKLTQLFCERLLKIVTDFYIDTKINRLRRNVERLQTRSDSIGRLLNKQTYESSNENKKLIDLNPAYSTSSVPAEITARDKMVLSTIYAEVVKNLEINKTALIQETPTVEIVDRPELPLKLNKVKWYAGLLQGCIAGFIIVFFGVILLKKGRSN